MTVFTPTLLWISLTFYEATWWIENLVAFPALFLIVNLCLFLAMTLLRAWAPAALCVIFALTFFLLSPKNNHDFVVNCVNPITVAQYNLYYENPDINAFINDLLSSSYDLVVLQEVAPEVGEKLHSLDDHYPYYFGGQEGVGYPASQMILSRYPLKAISVYMTPDQQAIIRGVWYPNTQKAIDFIAAHPPSPRTKALWYRRNALIRTIESLIEIYPSKELLVVGDFNLSSVSLRFGKILPSFQTAPVASWPNVVPFETPSFLKIAIDHLWLKATETGRRICQRTSFTEPKGSDHNLVVTTIGY
nr:endonuclease/exonuclease/phosphatase family protein [Vibrio sp. JPW-9-11-11]